MIIAVTDWDDLAAPEDCFYWASNNPESEDYGVIIGYKKKIDNYTLLRFPTRCTKIELKEPYEDGTTEEASRAFTQNIKKVEIPGTVKYIDDYTFGDTHSHNTFKNCEEVVLEYGILDFGRAFYENSSVRKVTIPNSVTSIDFWNCTNLREITIPDGVIKINLKGCSNLSFSELILPNSVQDIQSLSIKTLTRIKIPDSVIKIGEYAFSGCTELSEITIPSSVVYMGEGAFSGWTNQKIINIETTEIPSSWDNAWKLNCSAIVNLGYTGE